MKSLNQAVKDLEYIVTKNIDRYRFPEIKGNSIRISHLLIRSSKKHGFIIVDVKNNKTVETAYSKSGAIAIALACLKNQNYKTLIYYDSVIEKNTNDSEFYSYAIDKTTETSRKEALLNRFEDSTNKVYWARNALDECILKDFR